MNSRRLAERLAAALNEFAGEEIARAHHGSLARETRLEVEDLLKQGRLPALVATSSLELGIDMGAVDLVIQLESPPSVAAAIQRIGRAGHRVGETSRGILLPKVRSDLLACAAVVPAIREGRVEPTRVPRNPLDVLAQQVVATVAMGAVAADDLYGLVRRAAPFRDLPRSSFVAVLDMLSGRYPAAGFPGLLPRVTWDRASGLLSARQGAHRAAVVDGGTIPDRGLFGVWFAGEGGRLHRVGELDEEMIYESRPGEVVLLGASSWRIEAISNERVLVSPAPGEPGKMPFWRGDRPGRPFELGREVGSLARRLLGLPPAEGRRLLEREHGLTSAAAEGLSRWLGEQAARGSLVPTDTTLVLEVFPDEVGDLRAALLSPYGSRVHAPWAIAIQAAWRARAGVSPDVVWSDDGLIVRLPPSGEEGPLLELLLPRAAEVEGLLLRELGSTSLFGGRFREAASRALLLPRRAPGRRTPLWIQRRRSADLLRMVSAFPDFPIVLEAYRECLEEAFDLPALSRLLSDVEAGRIEVRRVRTSWPSPAAAALAFAWAAEFFYAGDAPHAERRAFALALDPDRLREVLGEVDLRALLDPDALAEVEARLLAEGAPRPLRHADQVHDLLLAAGGPLRGGDGPVDRRPAGPPRLARGTGRGRPRDPPPRRRRLAVGGRRGRRPVPGRPRGLPLDPPAIPPALLLAPAPGALEDLIGRFARTHGPFPVEEVAERFGLGVAAVRPVLLAFAERGRLTEGAFRPGGRGREWCDPDVLAEVRRRSLARVRRSVAPVPAEAFARFALAWHGVGAPPADRRDLREVVSQLEGAALPAAILEHEILPARLPDYRPGDLDALCAAGEVTWRGAGGARPADTRIVLLLSEHAEALAPAQAPVEGPVAARVLDTLRRRGALFFRDLLEEVGVSPRTCSPPSGIWSAPERSPTTRSSPSAPTSQARPPGPASAAPGVRRSTPSSGPGPPAPRAAGPWRPCPDPTPPTPPGAWPSSRTSSSAATGSSRGKPSSRRR